MKSDKPEPTDFVPLGSYAPREAVKLLARFKAAGIPFRMQPRKPSPQPGPTAGIYISVDAARGTEVAQIHRDLFGDGLPNYDSHQVALLTSGDTTNRITRKRSRFTA